VEFAPLAVEIATLIVAVDLVLGWVQLDPKRWPRRLSHMLTEPLLVPVRAVVRRLPTRGWDLSPAVLILGLTLIKVGVLQ
jgi:uncharacterized protein YggT (Ycf19 family)